MVFFVFPDKKVRLNPAVQTNWAEQAVKSAGGISIFGVLLALILMSLKYSGNAAAATAGTDDDYDPLENDKL